MDRLVWTVRRRWLPRRLSSGVRARYRRRTRSLRDKHWFDLLDAGDGCGDELPVVGVLIAVVVGVLTLVMLTPMVLFGLEVLLIVLVIVPTAVARFVLRRPWRVEAQSSDGQRREWRVKGYQDAGRLRDTLQAEFDLGLDPAPDKLWR